MREFGSHEKFSEVITEEEMLNWNSNVILNGGTGTGKTYLVLEKLAKLHKNKRFLYLVNRIMLGDEIQTELTRLGLDNIELKTYQSIDKTIELGYTVRGNWDYIICDEFHYVVEDSTFNELTQNSYDFILNYPTIKIFMSATCNSIFGMFDKQEIVKSDQHYYIPKSYDYVDQFVFYKKQDNIREIIQDILHNTNDKIVFFTHRLNLGLKLHKEFEEDSILHCSSGASIPEAVKISKEMNHRLTNNTFDSRLLITTTALDNGINLKDRDIKHVICSMYNPIQLEQCLGRKRVLDENDTCSFYFYERNIGQFNRIPYYNYDSIHPLTVRKIKGVTDNTALDHIKGRKFNKGYIEGIGFKEYIIDSLKFDRVKVIDYEVIQKGNNSMQLETYLDSVVGKVMLTPESRIELIEKLDVRDGRNNRLLKGLDTLNGMLNENNLNFYIRQFETSRIENGIKKKYKSAWKVMKLID